MFAEGKTAPKLVSSDKKHDIKKERKASSTRCRETIVPTSENYFRSPAPPTLQEEESSWGPKLCPPTPLVRGKERVRKAPPEKSLKVFFSFSTFSRGPRRRVAFTVLTIL